MITEVPTASTLFSHRVIYNKINAALNHNQGQQPPHDTWPRIFNCATFYDTSMGILASKNHLGGSAFITGVFLGYHSKRDKNNLSTGADTYSFIHHRDRCISLPGYYQLGQSRQVTYPICLHQSHQWQHLRGPTLLP